MTGQDYIVSTMQYFDDRVPLKNDPGWATLSNSEWPRIYSQQYVSGYSDLVLIVNNTSFDVRISQNWTYHLENPTNDSCDWVPLQH